MLTIWKRNSSSVPLKSNTQAMPPCQAALHLASGLPEASLTAHMHTLPQACMAVSHIWPLQGHIHLRYILN